VGGWIEPVDVPSLGITICVNEEGLIRQLPRDPRATFLWWFHVPANRQKAILVGDALLAGMADHRVTVLMSSTRCSSYALPVRAGGLRC
jgi:hypothetical protein